MSYYIGFNHIEFCYIILYHILYNYIFSYISYHIILFVCIHFVFVTLLFPLIFSQFLCHSLPLLLVPSHFLILSLLFHFSRHLICSFSLSLSLSLSLTLSLSISLALPPLSLFLSLSLSLSHSLSLSLSVSLTLFLRLPHDFYLEPPKWISLMSPLLLSPSSSPLLDLSYRRASTDSISVSVP